MGLIGALLALSAAAWIAVDARMSDLDLASPGGAGQLIVYLGVWATMMAAMMFPSVAPMVLVYRRVQASRLSRGTAVAGGLALFVAGYLLVWTGFGLLAWLVAAAVDAADVMALEWDRSGHLVAAAVIAGAAVYQLTPLKNACLTRCRGPMDFVLGAWRDGRAGALAMGAEHGAWCVGCCWALMAALLAVGTMSIGAMALVAGLIATEKLFPHRRTANLALAAVLLAVAALAAFAPGDFPGRAMHGHM